MSAKEEFRSAEMVDVLSSFVRQEKSVKQIEEQEYTTEIELIFGGCAVERAQTHKSAAGCKPSNAFPLPGTSAGWPCPCFRPQLPVPRDSQVVRSAQISTCC